MKYYDEFAEDDLWLQEEERRADMIEAMDQEYARQVGLDDEVAEFLRRERLFSDFLAGLWLKMFRGEASIWDRLAYGLLESEFNEEYPF